MSDTAAQAAVTLSTATIHNPKEARHFMRLKPVRGTIRILHNGQVLAQSTNAVRLLEAGRDLYDPVLYLPPSDICAALAPAAKERTFCPLKGHASYFDLVSKGGEVLVPEIAWSYHETLDFADEMRDLIAFNAKYVTVEEQPPHEA